jgi:PIN domain nuclease of toxin-antitoxin system
VKRLLLDTEAFIWWDADDRRLGARARKAVRDAEVVCVSAASAWEIAIKSALGKLETTRDPARAATDSGFTPLPVLFAHAAAVGGLPAHHRDPFDRLLIATAHVEGLTIVTSDDQFRPYRVPMLDARQ